ncbi:uncharacterized protein EV422DRAFT_569301 [Fimicolochytrium jonesii]|uniref:uncharacterized protein n=1 Tax=Fimicolochytrium jonesii TaxID=1396493 RepID=UPI0022FEF717|nr:uncharacterized protein EV422DRAFT_569301 [Fimicolochytrium jonesii]KAI8819023.1 hypothetical protein EV422DRAFT_569301 [Fimicolochytrium jonesii]
MALQPSAHRIYRATMEVIFADLREFARNFELPICPIEPLLPKAHRSRADFSISPRAMDFVDEEKPVPELDINDAKAARYNLRRVMPRAAPASYASAKDSTLNTPTNVDADAYSSGAVTTSRNFDTAKVYSLVNIAQINAADSYCSAADTAYNGAHSVSMI